MSNVASVLFKLLFASLRYHGGGVYLVFGGRWQEEESLVFGFLPTNGRLRYHGGGGGGGVPVAGGGGLVTGRRKPPLPNLRHHTHFATQYSIIQTPARDGNERFLCKNDEHRY